MAAIRASLPARSTLVLAGGALAANAAAAALATRSTSVVVVVVLAASVAVLAFVRPAVVLCGAVFGIVASDLLDQLVAIPRLSVAGLELQITDLMLAAILLAWLGWELRREGVPGPPLAALAREPAFVAFVPLLGLALYDLARGGYGTLSSSRIFLYCILVPVAVRVLETPRQLRILGGTVVGAGVAASIGAGAMLAAGRSVTNSGLSTGGIRGLSIGGSFLVAGALLYVLASTVGGAQLPSVVAPVLILVLAAGVAASGSRETWVGVLGALAIYALISPLRGVVRLALVLGLAGLLALGAYSIAPQPPRLSATVAAIEHRLASVDPGAAARDPSVQVRYDKWRVVWDQLKAHPLLGTGFGYPATYTSNIGGNNFVRSYVDDPENTQLWLWARMGTLGFVAWVAFNLLALGTLLVRFLRSRSADVRTAALWAAGVLVVVWSGMVFSPVSAFASTLLLYWLAIALVPVTARLGAADQ